MTSKSIGGIMIGKIMDEATIYDICSKIGKEYGVPIHTIFNKPIVDGNDEIVFAIAVEFVPKFLGDDIVFKTEKIFKEISELMAFNNCKFIRTEKYVWYGKLYYYDKKTNYVRYRLLFDYEPVKQAMLKRW